MTPDVSQLATPLLPKQAEFIFDAEHSELLYSGAYGAGKTRALCWRAVHRAADPRAWVGLGRRTMADLRRTTLRTLLEPSGDLPAVLSAGSFIHRRTVGEERIQLHGGGTIVPFGFDSPEALGSAQFSDAMIDEAVECSPAQWTQIMGRLRVSFHLGDGRMHLPSLSAATNPGGPTHFLFERFYRESRPGYRKVIEAPTAENFFLPHSYLRMLGEMRGITRLRYLFGKWAAAEGLVYPMFAPEVHVRHNAGPWSDWVAGVDYGFTNPMVLRVHGIDGDGRSHVVGSFYKRGITTDEFLDWCRLARSTYSDDMTFMVDPSAAELIERMRRADFDARPANNDVAYGISLIRTRLNLDASGVPRLTMEPDRDGSSGQQEYLAYAIDEKATQAEKPKKQDDHVPDADRYAVCEIERRYGSSRTIVMGRMAPAELPTIVHDPDSQAWLDEPLYWK